MTKHFVILDTNAGFLQWSGEAASAEDAIQALAATVGDVNSAELAVQEVTAEQRAATEAWWEGGADAAEFPL